MGSINIQVQPKPGSCWFSFPVFFYFLLLFCHPSIIRAQTWDEIFSQKKTQIKYLGQQIAALEMFSAYVKRGYEICSDGVDVVKTLKNGEYSFHDAFYASLKVVNPLLKGDFRVGEIITLQLTINHLLSGIEPSPVLTNDQRRNIDFVKAGLQGACNQDLQELLTVLSSGNIEMSDDQRLRRLAAIYHRIQQKAAFTQTFCIGINQLITARSGELDDLEAARLLYGLKL